MSFVENNNFDKIENSRRRREAIVSRRLHSKPPLMQSKKARVVWNEKLLLTNLSKNEWPGQDKFNSSRCIRLEKAGAGSQELCRRMDPFKWNWGWWVGAFLSLSYHNLVVINWPNILPTLFQNFNFLSFFYLHVWKGHFHLVQISGNPI